MTDTTTTDSRCRSARPERITVADEVFVRNDVLAREQGTSTRTIDRGDAHGAPYTFVAGVKYRPERAYHAFMLSRIQVRGQAPKRRRRGSAS
jgi:hypothetical protein